MTGVARDGEDFAVDAGLLAEAFALPAEEVVRLLREGAITSRVERGEGEDAGRFRLTFFHASARLRLVVDEAGAILSRSRLAYEGAPLPAALRRPGA